MGKGQIALACWLLASLAAGQRVETQIEQVTTTGQVVDDRSQPVEGAEIVILSSRSEPVLSDAQGYFETTWSYQSRLNQRPQLYVLVRHRGRNLGLVSSIGIEGAPLTLRLKPGVWLAGKVVGPRDEAIAGADVAVAISPVTANWASTIESHVRTGGTGAFRIGAVRAEGRYTITTRADGYGVVETVVDIDAAVEGLLDVGRIELPVANMVIAGRVVDIDGHPLSGMDVYCIGEGQPDCDTKSDAQGRFVLDGLCAGAVRLMAEGRVAGDYVSCDAFTEAGARDITVVPRRGFGHTRYLRAKSHEQIVAGGNPYIAGYVVDEDGAPVADVPVHVRYIQRKGANGRETKQYFNAT